MNQIINRIATRYLVGYGFIGACLFAVLTACHTNPNVVPAIQMPTDSTITATMTADGDSVKPPKKPAGPGCCN